MKLQKLILPVAYLSLFGISYSVELELDEVISRAKVESSEIKIQGMNTEIQKKGKNKALKNLILPPINLSQEDDWDIIKEEGVGIRELEMGVPLFMGGKNLNSYRKAKNNLELAYKEEIFAENRAIEKAVGAYFDILNYQKQSEIINNAVKAMDKQKGRLQGLYKGGKIVPKSELLKVEADIERYRSLNLENARLEKKRTGDLNRILNLPLDTKITGKDILAGEYLGDRADASKYADRDIDNTHLVQAEKLKLKNAEYDLKIAKADLYPTFYIKDTYTFRKWDNEKNELYKPKDRNEDENKVELGFRYYFAWGGTLDSVNQKKYELKKAQLMHDENVKEIQLDIENKINEIDSLYGQANANQKKVDLLRENMNIDSMRYENQLITTYDYLNSVNAYREAQEEYYAIQRKLVLAVIELENLYR
ncbi:TolC family protein [uncultured Fusobacterium sp.]|uniref:TolC family protein n=1 Tax=uncultured Fusobacterium sp. TaxID=159267 RepID=UPI0015A686CF|nr:TolC family protein [uncultured Fusobacterium sp.]